MNKTLGFSIVASMALALTACGGDSDSSGEAVDVVTPPNSSQMSACIDDGIGYFKVPDEGCTYTHADYNNGQTVTFTCDGTTVKNSLGESSPNQIGAPHTDHNFFCE